MTLAPLRAWLRSRATRPRFLALASFLFAGDLKADPRLAWLPVDLTLLTGACLSGVLLLRLARGSRVRSPRVLALVGLLYFTFLPGLWGAVPSAYGLQKVATLFTFTLLSFLAPLLLVEEAGDLDGLVNAMACFCLAITLGGLLGGGAGGGAPERLQAFGAGTISLGRATGLLFLVAALALAREGPLPALTFAILALAGITALFSGSRGPIMAALLVLGLLFTLGRYRLGRRAWKLAGAAAALTALLAGSLAQAPAGSLRRVESFFRGQAGSSELYRLAALQGSWGLIQVTPAGLGWGRFATDVDPEKGLDRQYPHNLLAEVTLEGGWLCGLAMALVLTLAVASAWSRTAAPEGRLVFAGVVFYLVNALVSGDVNDNRPLFMFVTAALALPQAKPLVKS
jgi:hypothetical protein